MNQLEERLHRAATELRQVADSQSPPSIPVRRHAPNRGWLAFAATFVVVMAMFGILPLMVETTPDSRPTGSTPIGEPSPTSTSQTQAPCSASGFGGPTGGVEAPRAVAATRAALIEAARDCNFDALEARADDSFVTGFGGGGVESFRSWESAGEGRLDTLLAIFQMSFEVIETGDAGTLYVWPAAYAYESWDQIPAEALGELLAVYSPEELEAMRDADAYLGWRTAIDGEGRWRFFIAGD